MSQGLRSVPSPFDAFVLPKVRVDFQLGSNESLRDSDA